MRLIPVFLAALLAIPAPAPADTDAGGIARMQAADIVILGEVHDNADHHAGQARLIAEIAPKVVVFEMLTPGQAAQVNADDRADLDGLADRIGWAASGWPDFPLYRPVFAALGETPVVGAALPRDRVRAAFDTGAATVFGPDAGRFGLDTPLPPEEQETRAALQFAAHCEAMPMHLMAGMVEAQRLRDAHFSAVTLEALATYGAPVVVIAGTGHARKDWGMPALIARAAPDTVVHAVGFAERPAPDTDPRFDTTIVTDPADRPDPCTAFAN
ncbi:hypothetical protein BOO69_14660 [Sulfitobacter alexandrii]|uniref:Haem-binding uptake Tiki superfamily ChaN domain-containing protein n=1 Tax=Sulfitobacter alexandrii TaxID=1917485 RepID=A0A1J0WJP5_9RHOB|nr:ChaN family lipoprotein [Sulfitobacter alexandrii]APE44517.1 hypothetical protein BOO69_14660 [Sulfitobacter alexandrii]